MAKVKKDLQEMAGELLEKAEKRGVQSNFFFRTTFNRYLVQLQILKDLEKAIEEYGTTVTKEYVKGRANLMANPAITEYNRTTTAANATVATLINIIKSLGNEEDKGSRLQELIDGLNDE
jgi:hypothetical protein